jgi:excisionase family DNA binding protein
MELLTIRDTAQMLKVSAITVRRFIADGRLPAVKVGKGVRVHKEAVEKLARPVEPKAPKAKRATPTLRGRPTSADDPLWNIVGIGASAEPTDLAQHKLEYLADAYAPRAQ